MSEKKITNPDENYYVVSLKHTHKKDKYITLWRPDNAGYCWSLKSAGIYRGYEDGYHKSEGNIPIKVADVPPGFLVFDSENRVCIKLSKDSKKFFLSYQP